MENAIAVTGMALRAPKTRTLDEFWDHLINGRDCITRFSADEIRANEPDLDKLLKRPEFVMARGVLEDVDQFDAGFFGMSPREASVLDPQQRLWLEAAWEALEMAGIDPQRPPGPIGVFAGAGYMEQYLMYHLCKDRAYLEDLVKLRAVDAFSAVLANDKDYLPTRTAYKFDLKGPALNIQTACSSSLVNIHQACQSLLNHESDACLAGGVSVMLPQERGYLALEGGMLSVDGYCRPFDEKAGGTVFSSGLGVVVLRRLEDALEAGEDVQAVIRGSALNNDGANKVSFVAPSVEGQSEVISMAQAVADIDAGDIGYIEAHGTATPLGDPIEIAGLTQAFSHSTDKKQYCRIGSVKSNIGHTDSAAGVLGLIKVILSLKHGVIPKSLHFNRPNPRIDFSQTPFLVANESVNWEKQGVERLAGVSSFGVGGTNAHIVLSGAPEAESTTPSEGLQALVLSSKCANSLAARVADTAAYLEKNEHANLADVAYSLASGRQQFLHRTMVAASNREEAITRLKAVEKSAAKVAATDDVDPPVVFLFPGQGSQHPGMGAALYEAEPVFRETVDRLCDYLQPILELDLRTVLFASGDESAAEKLTHTGLAQPAIFIISYATAKLWQHWGIEPEAMLGHSVGEYVAACLAGIFSEEDAVKVIAHRARLMESMPAGGMLALRADEQEALPLLGDNIAVAAVNAPGLTVVSGPHEDLQQLEKKLADSGQECIKLHTSHAFHSSMMDAALEPFKKIFSDVSLNTPTKPLLSCRSGIAMTDEQATSPEYWAEQLRYAVRFSDGMTTLSKEKRHVYLEVGPSQNLTAAVRQHRMDSRPMQAIPSLPHANQDGSAAISMYEALGKLWQRGVAVDWEQFFENQQRHKVSLPTYRFQRERYWIEPPPRYPDQPTQATVSSVQPVVTASEKNSTSGTPSIAMNTQTQTPPRRDRIVTELCSLLHELSGTRVGEADLDVAFLELGMDSLFLTQAAAELSNRFEVTLKFRQLLEQIDTVNLLADHLDDILPEEALPAPVAEVAAETAPVPVAASAAMPSMPVSLDGGGEVATLIQQQIALMNRQLDMMGSGGGSVAAVSSQAGTNNEPEAAAKGLAIEEGSQGKKYAQNAANRFGPYKVVERGKDGDLTSPQARFLEALIQELTAKTKGSREAAESSRSILADPRSVANFRLVWKELVYQIVCASSKGSRLWDIDGNEYVDITMGFGVGFLGHRPEYVTQALHEQVDLGFEVGPQTPLAPIVAEKLCKITGHERATFTNTGSEANMAALRCARTVTGRRTAVYFTGDYHGTFDEVLGRANIVNDRMRSLPAAPGIVPEVFDHTWILDYGTQESLDLIEKHHDQIAAVLVEPVQSRYPDLQPQAFLKDLRRITEEKEIALILDEVITGFRVGPGGISEAWGVKPDMSVYGKILGGGVPIGALAGNAKYLDAIDGGPWNFGDDSLPEAAVTFFAGTFVRHPLAMAAANAVLDHVSSQGPQLQRAVNERTAGFAERMNAFFEQAAVPIRIRHCSSWFRFDFPSDSPFVSLLFFYMLKEGVYIREAAQNCFFSVAHTDEDIARVEQVIRDGVTALQAAEFLPSADSSAAIAPQSQESSTTQELAASVAPGAGMAVGETVPLTHAQLEIWLAMQLDPAATRAFNEAFQLQLKGDLNTDAFRQAVQDIVARHEALNLRFPENGEHQQRAAFQAVEVPVTDLRNLSEENLRSAINENTEACALDAYDVLNGPVMRVDVLWIADQEFLCLFGFHHLVCDGWSSVVFLEELGGAYAARLNGLAPNFPEATPFSSYVKQELKAEAGESRRKSLAYWKAQFAQIPEPLSLPFDRPHPSNRSYNGQTCRWDFGDDVAQQVTTLAKKNKVTVHSLLLAIYQVFLARVSGQTEAVVGMPVAGQALVNANELFGHCVNLVPVRGGFDPKEPFSDFLSRAKTLVADAYEHAECTYGTILNELHVTRRSGRNPLIEVMFNLDPAGEAVQFQGLSTEINEIPKQAVNFDLFFNITRGPNKLVMDCDFNADVLNESTVRQWIQLYSSWISLLAEDASISIESLPLVAHEDRNKLLNEWNNTALAFDDSTTVDALINKQATTNPDAIALSCGEEALSYADLWLQAGAVAASLSEHGVSSGDNVAVCLPRDIRLIPALVGVWRAGAAYIPLDPAYPEDRISGMLTDSEATAVLCTADTARLINHDIAIDIDKALACAQPLPDITRQPSDLAYVIYTSGSTGVPKGVAIEHRHTLALLAWARDCFAERLNNVVASTSICFDLSVFEIFSTLSSGGRVHLIENILSLPTLKAEKGSLLISAVPSAVAELMDVGGDLTAVSTACLAGEALSAKLVDQLYAAGLEQVWDAYGPSEATTYSTAKLREVGGEPLIGKPIANYQAYVLDEGMNLVPPGVTGEYISAGKV